jgi:aminoglycoside/choline kinase family phosphotransferase
MEAPRDRPRLDDPWTSREALAGDASTRSYHRLRHPSGRTAILAGYPPEIRGQLLRDLEVHRWLSGFGIRVPELLDHDLERGLVLLEDLGPDDGEKILGEASVAERTRLLGRTLEPLVILARQATDDLPGWNPPLDASRLRWELAGFEMWYARRYQETSPSAAVARWLDGLADEVGEHPRRICHRDYHLNNLFFLSEGEVAVIDAQDVLVGPDTYDGVSLLSERATPTLLSSEQSSEWRREWARRTAAAPGWRERWRRVRLQRGLKVLGTFARLWASGRPEYLGWMTALSRDLVEEAAVHRLPDELIELLID